MKQMRFVAAIAAALLVMCVSAHAQTTVFTDDFENGTGNWTVFPGTPECTPIALVSTTTDPNCNITPGGSFGLEFNSTTDRVYHDFVLDNPTYSELALSVWLYDDGSSSSNAELFDIRQAGLRQVLGMGRSPFMGWNSAKYQCRILKAADYSAGVNWVNTSIDRTAGWHQFTIVQKRGTNTVQFLVDGVLGYESNDAYDCALDRIVIGAGYPSSTTVSTGYVDNVMLTTVPEPGCLTVMVSSLVGFAALARRRRA